MDNIKIAGRILQACMRARERGVDAFVDYSPHVHWLEVCIFRHGWYGNHDYDEAYIWDLKDNEWDAVHAPFSYFSTEKALKILSKELGEDLTHD